MIQFSTVFVDPVDHGGINEIEIEMEMRILQVTREACCNRTHTLHIIQVILRYPMDQGR